MNILITGASGPLGQYFITECLQIFPQAKILALSKTTLITEDTRVEYLHHNLKTDRFMRTEAYDFVIHTASIVPNKAEEDSDFISINCVGSLRLFQEITFNKSAAILNMSSTSVYHDPDAITLTENSKKTTNDLYGISKLQFESMLAVEFRGRNINILTCRIPILLVKNVQNNFLAGWVLNILKNKKIKLFNPDDLFNACVNEKDILKFFLSFHQRFKNKNLTCNLSSSNPISITALAHQVMESLGKQTGIHVEESTEVAQLVSNKLAVEHGFKPQSVKDSIKSFIE